MGDEVEDDAAMREKVCRRAPSGRVRKRIRRQS